MSKVHCVESLQSYCDVIYCCVYRYCQIIFNSNFYSKTLQESKTTNQERQQLLREVGTEISWLRVRSRFILSLMIFRFFLVGQSKLKGNDHKFFKHKIKFMKKFDIKLFSNVVYKPFHLGIQAYD